MSVGAARFAVACAAVTSVAACGLDLNGLETGEAGTGGLDATADVTTDGRREQRRRQRRRAGDLGRRPGTTGDVVVSEAAPADGCVPTGAESCTNGVDDDCNGLVDCADPACAKQGYTCATPAPTGWDFVALDATSQTGCPATLTQKNVDVDPANTPAVCGCTCALTTNPSCGAPNISAKYGNDNTCSAGPAMNYPANNGACSDQAYTVAAFVLATPPPATGGTCTATPSVTKAPVADAGGGVQRGEELRRGVRRRDGVRARAAPGSARASITAGRPTCPGGYPTSHQVGTLQDNRGCSPCTCDHPTATCGGSWNFFGAARLQRHEWRCLSRSDGKCDPTGATAPTPSQSNQFALRRPLGCPAPAQPTPTGGVQLGGADTICCQ